MKILLGIVTFLVSGIFFYTISQTSSLPYWYGREYILPGVGWGYNVLSNINDYDSPKFYLPSGESVQLVGFSRNERPFDLTSHCKVSKNFQVGWIICPSEWVLPENIYNYH